MKLYKLTLFAITVAAAISCAKEITPIDQPSIGGSVIEITASFADNQAKTILQDGSTSVYWEPGDEVKMFYDGTGGRFSNQFTEVSNTAKFSGSLNVVFLSSEGFSDSTPLWGLYPYRADATADNSSVTTTLPSEQTGRAGSFAKGMNISLGKTSSLSMGFYNVCGGVRFSVTRNDVKNVIFEALNGESLAGKVKLGFEGGVPAVQEVTEGVDSIVLAAPAAGCFETGKWYYIVALPGTLSGGFKMTFNTDTKYAVLKSTTSRSIARGTFGSLAEADKSLVYKDKSIPEPKEGNIVFKDIIAKYACVEKFDTDSDGELSYDEAAAVTSIAGLFTDWASVTRFDELKYFTKITSLSSAMKGLTSLKSVTIPAGFTSLEDNAFDGCSSLDSVTFAGTAVSSIGIYAFRNCTALKQIDIPSKVSSIGNYAFNGCSSLTSVDIPSGVSVIKSYCFQNCSSLESVDLPSSLASISHYAFSGCTNLEAIDFPSSLNTIGNYAIQNCTSLKSVSVPNSVSSFGTYVFSGCTFLESASLPSGMTSIPTGTFSGCNRLYHITFPSALTTIGNEAFNGCLFFDSSTRVSKIELPSTVTTIGSSAFSSAEKVLITSSSFVSIQSNTFSSRTRIYVPDAKVDIYKIRTGWSSYASNIFSLSSYSDKSLEILSVDLGLSVKWASFNIGASNPEEYGRYFAWGDVTGQTSNGSSWSGGGFSSYPTYEVDSNNNLKPAYDAAHVILGGNWRMPTKAEFDELKSNCTYTWTDNYNSTGVAGRIFTSKKNGYSIFLPAAGFGKVSNLINAGSGGYYWSSTFGDDDYAWRLYFTSSDVHAGGTNRYYGRSVRPVTE